MMSPDLKDGGWIERANVSVTVKIGSVFVLLSLVFGTLLIANAYLTKQLVGASAAINYAGTQRMRVYKLALLVRMRVGDGPTPLERQVLLQEIREMERVFSGLQDGDAELELVGETDPEIRRRIQRMRNVWADEMRPALEAAMATSAGAASPPFREYVDRTPDFAMALSEVVELIEHRLAARVDLLYALQLMFLIGACGVAGGGIYALNRVVRVPLEQLTKGVQQFADGTLPASIPIRSRDELGQLARAFEMMAGSMRTHIEHLEAMHATGQEFSSQGDGGLEHVLRRTTDTAAALVKADLAFLLVRHPLLDCWIVEATSESVFHTMHKQLVLLEQTPFACQAFETKQPVVILDTDDYPDKRLLFRERFEAKSYLIVPLLGPHEVIGVLVLLGKQARTFSQREIRLALSSAAYAAIALENAHLFEATESEVRDLRERVQTVEHQVAELTHEVKAPAGRVAEFAAWIERDYGDRLDERAKRYLAWIKKEGNDLAQLAGRTLDFARMIQEPTPLERVDANLVVREVLDLLGAECAAKGIRVSVSGNLPLLACRRVHLKQVMENLISNAIKYMGEQPEPAIEIGTEWREDGLHLYVRDNGVGMEPGMADRIFLPFQRLGHVETTGAGLGLTIVKTIVEHYGGVVQVASKPGGGSTFYVRLPVLDEKWAGSAVRGTAAE